MSFRLGNGNTFNIIGKGASAENLYVQSATLNGRPLVEPCLRHKDIVTGGTLEITMGPAPSAWGCAGEFDARRAAEELSR